MTNSPINGLAGAGSSRAKQEREQEHLQVLADYTLAIGTALNPGRAEHLWSTPASKPTMRSPTLTRELERTGKKGGPVSQKCQQKLTRLRESRQTPGRVA